MPSADDRPSTPHPDRTTTVLLSVAALVVIFVVALWLWSTRGEPQPPVPAAPAPSPEARAPSLPPAPPALPAPPAAPQHPLKTPAQPLEAQDIAGALAGLLGTKAVTGFLQADNFPRRFAATVDSLGREHSPTVLWPVLKTPGRFLVQERDGGTVIAPENAARYTPLVLLAGTIDVTAAVQLYRRMYPLLQQAYRELGFGDRYLNDRVVEVIDELLATPDAPEAPRVELPVIRGPIPSLEPWVRYRFVDPALESLHAGQKILVRVGPVNQRRLKAKLAELRRELVRTEASTSNASGAAEGAAAVTGPK